MVHSGATNRGEIRRAPVTMDLSTSRDGTKSLLMCIVVWPNDHGQTCQRDGMECWNATRNLVSFKARCSLKCTGNCRGAILTMITATVAYMRNRTCFEVASASKEMLFSYKSPHIMLLLQQRLPFCLRRWWCNVPFLRLPIYAFVTCNILQLSRRQPNLSGNALKLVVATCHE